MKKLIVLLLLLLPVGAFSQEFKIAFVNFQEIFEMMPEMDEAETKMAAARAQYTSELKALEDEYNVKMSEYQKIESTLNENLKLRRQQELMDLQERYNNFLQVAQQDMEQEQAKIFTPLQEKLLKAIKDVGTEQGYIVFNAQAMFHTGNAIDATSLVKAKLGIK